MALVVEDCRSLFPAAASSCRLPERRASATASGAGSPPLTRPETGASGAGSRRSVLEASPGLRQGQWPMALRRAVGHVQGTSVDAGVASEREIPSSAEKICPIYITIFFIWDIN